VDTVYFGGGTPSLLTAEQISSIISEIRSCFALEESAEITLEANPCTLNAEKLAELHKIGINRLSIGVQSMIERELKILGRMHTAERAEQAVLEAARAGFDNISCDLMIALPGQDLASVEYSIDRMSRLPIRHISAYILKVEEGTPFDRDEIRCLLPDDDTSAAMYLRMAELLEQHGFMQYEVSNFAKSGYESRHNCRYWRCQDYIGIGPAAHSCYSGVRFAVSPDLTAFISSEVQHTEVTDDSPCGYSEYAMLRLRLKEGLLLDRVPEHKGEIEKKIPALVNAGYITYNNGCVSLTREGFLISNQVIEYLVF
jgi:oxygen-independent coproporphyrinogen-3 oxidase